jgi:hypothetical protein
MPGNEVSKFYSHSGQYRTLANTKYLTLISLANSILSVTFAQLFRRFYLSPKDTNDADIDWDDCFASRTRGHFEG